MAMKPSAGSLVQRLSELQIIMSETLEKNGQGNGPAEAVSLGDVGRHRNLAARPLRQSCDVYAELGIVAQYVRAKSEQIDRLEERLERLIERPGKTGG